MGRGDSNLLGPLVTSKRSTRNKIGREQADDRKDLGNNREESEGNILFSPLQQQDNDLYALQPSGAAIKKAREIAAGAGKGNFLPLLMALDRKKDYVPGKSPALDLVFKKIFSAQADRVLRPYKLSGRDKNVKREREILNKEAISLLAQRANALLEKNLSADEQIEEMRKGLEVDVPFLAEASLRSDRKGPVRDLLLDQIATSPLEDSSPEILNFMLGRGAPPEAREVFEEIIRRQIVQQLKSNLPYSATVARDLSYGTLRSSRKGPGLIHLVHGRKTVCGKLGAKTYRMEYGDWTDGVRAGRYKRCPQCEKDAPEDLRLRVEAEHSDRAADILSLERQREISDLARDTRIKSLVRASLRQGKPSHEIAEDVERYLLRKVSGIALRAADEAVQKDSRGRVAGDGHRHILWDSVPHEVDEKLTAAGYEPSSSMYYNRRRRQREDGDKQKDDDLLHLTTVEERKQALFYKMKADQVADYQKGKELLLKSEEVLARGIRRVLRQKRKEDSRVSEQLF